MKYVLIALLLMFAPTISAQEGAEAEGQPEGSPSGGTQVGDEEITGKAQLKIDDAEKPSFDLMPRLFSPLDSILDEKEQILNKRTLVVIDSFINESVSLKSPYLRVPTEENTLHEVIKIEILDPRRKEIKHWEIYITDAQGMTLKTYSGKGYPPKGITWDGKDENGQEVVIPGEPYNYILTIYGDAEQRLRLTGEPFKVKGFQYTRPDEMKLLMTTNVLFVKNTSEFSPYADERMREILNIAKLHYDNDIHVDIYCTDDLRSQMRGEAIEKYFYDHMELGTEVVQVNSRFFAGGPKYERVEIVIR
jgi:hypothetical protein